MTDNAPATATACILIVDDDEDVRDTLREVVEMGGCAAMVAANGAEALELLSVHRPCLVILDLLMPVMTGGELIEQIQKDPSLASLKILISTSAPARAPAGFPVLAKPISIHKLWEWMRQSCECATSVPPAR